MTNQVSENVKVKYVVKQTSIYNKRVSKL